MPYTPENTVQPGTLPTLCLTCGRLSPWLESGVYDPEGHPSCRWRECTYPDVIDDVAEGVPFTPVLVLPVEDVVTTVVEECRFYEAAEEAGAVK